jgi:hypothetical protein
MFCILRFECYAASFVSRNHVVGLCEFMEERYVNGNFAGVSLLTELNSVWLSLVVV